MDGESGPQMEKIRGMPADPQWTDIGTAQIVQAAVIGSLAMVGRRVLQLIERVITHEQQLSDLRERLKQVEDRCMSVLTRGFSHHDKE